MIEQLFFWGMIGLTIKHFIADAILQTPFQYLNKGIFLHPGGIVHACIHGLGTMIILFALILFLEFDNLRDVILLYYFLIFVPILSIIDAVVHYFIDFFKVKIGRDKNWSGYKENHLEIYSNNYFIALVLDQCLHFLTYIVIIRIFINILQVK